MELGLTGKRALITGGSKGIGLATATRLAMEGARVVIAARRVEELNEARSSILNAAPGADVYIVSADVATAEGADQLAQAALAHLGGIDILINNAGRSAGGPALDQTDEQWMSDLDLKFFASLRLSRLCLPSMKEAGGGRIINVTAIAGKHPAANSGPTSVSRAAGIALTKILSKELAAHNITVNTVCIGLIKSEQIGRAALRVGGDDMDAGYQAMGKNVPLGRVGEAHEAGDVIAFLVSERAAYINGVALNIDGGTSSAV